MFVLADFSVIKPDVGLLFWTTIFFLLFWLLIGKFAFKPIAEALKTREGDIQDALDEAKKAKQEMAAMQAENEKLILEAKQERAKILKGAQDTKNEIINQAKNKAKSEAKNIVTNAKLEIENQKQAAMLDLKNQVGVMALGIAEKVIKKDLSAHAEQQGFVNKLVDELNLN